MLEAELDARLLRRVLALRQASLLERVELAELASVARNVVETVLPVGGLVARAGQRVAAVHFVLDGCLTARAAPVTWGPRDVFGAVHVFAGRPATGDVIATLPTRTLQLDAGELGEVLEDNFGVLLSAIRAIAALVAAPAPRLRPAMLATTGPLGLVDRLFLLRRELPFVGARVRALATLAHRCTEMSWPAGATLVGAGELATAAYVLVEGELRAGATSLLPGDSIGWLETLAGHRHAAALEATTPARALVSSGAALLDLLEDHTDLGLHMLATLARELLDR